jgi:hypothetical protein
MKQPTVRFFDYSHFSEVVLCSATKILVKQSPEWRMFGYHPDFGRFIAKWFRVPGNMVVVLTQF